MYVVGMQFFFAMLHSPIFLLLLLLSLWRLALSSLSLLFFFLLLLFTVGRFLSVSDENFTHYVKVKQLSGCAFWWMRTCIVSWLQFFFSHFIFNSFHLLSTHIFQLVLWRLSHLNTMQSTCKNSIASAVAFVTIYAFKWLVLFRIFSKQLYECNCS